MGVRAVIFDLGGTLLHYYDPQHDDPRFPFRRVTMLGARAVLERVADGASAPPIETMIEVIDRHIGETARAMAKVTGGGSVETPIRAALAELGFPLDDAGWAALRPAYYAQIEPIVSPRAAVRESLAALHAAGYRLALVSNTWWAADFHDAHLARYGLLDLLPVRIYSCDTPHAKPHPDIFNMALEQVGVEAGEAAYVGDRPDIDVQGAQDAGLRGVMIRSPYEHTPMGATRPDAIIDELDELPGAVEKLQ